MSNRNGTSISFGNAARIFARCSGLTNSSKNPPPPAPSEASDVDELQRLADMHTAGTLTDEEFAAEKAKILGT